MTMLAEIPVRPIAIGILLLGFTVWFIFLLRLGAGGKPEPLPPNIKPYLTDDELEGRKVVQTGVLGLFSAVGLAALLAGYWLFLPNVQSDFGQKFDRESITRGFRLFATTEQGGLNCAGCHGGGKGGKIDNFVIPTGPNKGAKVSWECPSLDDVYYRFSRDEVKQVLIYGRPGTPMPAWGITGGGGQTDQQIEDLLDYMKFIEVAPADARTKAGGNATGGKELDGKALFLRNCARCHTPTFSYTPAEQREGLPQGIGAYGPNLTNEQNQFPDVADQIDFIKEGSTSNKSYGVNGIGNGRMPGFGRPDSPLLDDDQVAAIALYERSLRATYGIDARPIYPSTDTVTPSTSSPSPSPSPTASG